MRLALLLCVVLAGCDSGPGNLIEPPCTAPPGFVIEYNVVTKHYNWCFEGGYCPPFPVSSRREAIAGAVRQYEYGKTVHEKVYDPDKDRANWRKIENPCAKAVPESTAIQQQEPSA